MKLLLIRNVFKKDAAQPRQTTQQQTMDTWLKKPGSNGKDAYIKGKAFVEKNSGNAKLKVQFFWPFKAKYWIIDLADDYSYAVVSHPNKKYFWILARTPHLNKSIYKHIIFRLGERGFDITNLELTQQI